MSCLDGGPTGLTIHADMEPLLAPHTLLLHTYILYNTRSNVLLPIRASVHCNPGRVWHSWLRRLPCSPVGQDAQRVWCWRVLLLRQERGCGRVSYRGKLAFNALSYV